MNVGVEPKLVSTVGPIQVDKLSVWPPGIEMTVWATRYFRNTR